MLLTNCQEYRSMNEGGASEKRIDKDLEIFIFLCGRLIAFKLYS